MKGTDLLDSRIWEAFLQGIILAGRGLLVSLRMHIAQAPGYALMLASLVAALAAWVLGELAYLLFGASSERRVRHWVGRALAVVAIPLAVFSVLLQHR